MCIQSGRRLPLLLLLLLPYLMGLTLRQSDATPDATSLRLTSPVTCRASGGAELQRECWPASHQKEALEWKERRLRVCVGTRFEHAPPHQQAGAEFRLGWKQGARVGVRMHSPAMVGGYAAVTLARYASSKASAVAPPSGGANDASTFAPSYVVRMKLKTGSSLPERVWM